MKARHDKAKVADKGVTFANAMRDERLDAQNQGLNFAADGIYKEQLKILLASQQNVSIYLVNGVKLQGVISEFDNEVVLLQGTGSQLIMRSAISTILPTQTASN